MTDKKWAELRDAWGLEEVPAEIRRDIVCQMCLQSDTGRGKLFTEENLHYDGTIKSYNAMVERCRQNSYCRHHAEMMYADTVEGGKS